MKRLLLFAVLSSVLFAEDKKPVKVSEDLATEWLKLKLSETQVGAQLQQSITAAQKQMQEQIGQMELKSAELQTKMAEECKAKGLILNPNDFTQCMEKPVEKK
jgi:hypothetical protein